jgi:PAS domain S-box-containing protein
LDKKTNANTTSLQHMVERISHAFIALGKDGHFQYANSKAGELFGEDPAKLLGEALWKAYPQWALPSFKKACGQAFKNQETVVLEEYFAEKSSWYSLQIFPSPEGLTILFLDITAQKKEAAIQKNNEDDYRLMFENNPAPMWVINHETMQFLDVNHAAVRQYGYTREEFLSMTAIDIRPDDEKEKFIGTERPMSEVPKYYGIWKHERKDGTIIHMEMFSNWLMFHGQQARLVFGNDVTALMDAKNAIRASHDQYRALFEQASDPIMVTDFKGKFIDVNTSFCDMFGYTKEELQQMHVRDMIDPEDLKLKPMRFDLLAAGEHIFSERRMIKKDGTVILVEANVKKCMDDRVIAIARDITERKRIGDLLLKEKNLSDSIIKSLPGIFYLIDADGNHIRWNKNLETVSGYAPAEIPAQGHMIADADLEKVKETVIRVFEEGYAAVEARAKTKDGRLIPYLFTGVAIEYEDKPCLIGVGIDISSQKEAQETIHLSNERYDMVAKATNDAIWDWDLITNQVTRNSKRLETLFGYKGWEAGEVDKQWNRAAHPQDWVEVTRKRNLLLTDPSQNYWEDEYRFLRTDGEYAYVYDRAYILRDENGMAVRMIGASQDITERKKAEAELKEKNAELKKLSAYLQDVREKERKYIAREIHDELGQLASALKIDIDWLNIKFTGLEESVQKRIDHANRTIEVLISTVRKIASSLRPSILDDFGLIAALQWHCNEFQLLNGIQCKFEVGFDDKGLALEIKTELFRMAQESLTNVMRHSGATRVRVSLTEDAKHIYLTVTDNGKGFDTGQQKNTLGLIGLRERAQSVKGQLNVTSEPGKGTVVSAVIPKN